METGGDEAGSRFAVNCDIATPMRRRGHTVCEADLFAEVLLRPDGVTYGSWLAGPVTALPGSE